MRLPADVDEWWVFDTSMNCDQYIRQILESYRTTPTVCGRVSVADSQLADRLYQEKVPLTAVEGAFTLAADRRLYRHSARSLAPIHSLRYFLPIIREILDTPVDPGQVSYLWLKMQGRI